MFSVLKDDGFPKTFPRNCCKPVASLCDTFVDEVLTAGFCGSPVLSGHYGTHEKNFG